jgi:AcrR family transcriptional regulator
MGRGVSASPEDQFVTAGLRVLAERGAAELTLRRVAEAAGASTMGIYTRFGSRAGMLEAIYRRGFELLRDALVEARDAAAAQSRIMALGIAYRRFALANPPLYALMFERPLPDFDPSPAARTEALGMTFGLLTDEIADPARAYLVWTTVHGIVSIELTHALRSPLPGFFIDFPAAGERLLLDGVGALLRGLSA